MNVHKRVWSTLGSASGPEWKLSAHLTLLSGAWSVFFPSQGWLVPLLHISRRLWVAFLQSVLSPGPMGVVFLSGVSSFYSIAISLMLSLCYVLIPLIKATCVLSSSTLAFRCLFAFWGEPEVCSTRLISYRSSSLWALNSFLAKDISSFSSPSWHDLS